jgi:hypothetical protein
MKKLTAAISMLILSACTAYTLVSPGDNLIGPIKVNTSVPWNKSNLSNLGPQTEVWTASGKSLDSIYLFKGIPDGKPLFKTINKKNPMPTFKADMLPQEVLELTKASLTKHFGETNVLLDVGGLKPESFLNASGFRFDLRFSNQDGLNYLGKGVAAVQDDRLIMMIYTGTQLHYFAQHEKEFENIIRSAKL